VDTGVTLTGGSNYGVQLDGVITLTPNGKFGGNAIVIQKATNVEFFSSTGKGAINGQGYYHRVHKTSQNARLLRFISVSKVSVHDFLLVDSPTFHLVFNGVSDMETYHVTVRGANIGGTDGIDVICDSNCHVHHCEVTNRDECVCVKTPSKNVLIEDIICNKSGGMSIGSLTAADGEGPQIRNITMRNIQSYGVS
jgi:rhamnogalacturonan hydrolase